MPIENADHALSIGLKCWRKIWNYILWINKVIINRNLCAVRYLLFIFIFVAEEDSVWFHSHQSLLNTEANIDALKNIFEQKKKRKPKKWKKNNAPPVRHLQRVLHTVFFFLAFVRLLTTDSNIHWAFCLWEHTCNEYGDHIKWKRQPRKNDVLNEQYGNTQAHENLE